MNEIHTVWIDGEDVDRPDEEMASWGPNLRVWSSRDALGMRLEKTIFAMISENNFPGAADLMRYEILVKHGGICIDADLQARRALPKWIWDCCAVVAWENEIVVPGLLSTVFMRATKGYPLFASLVEYLASNPPNPQDYAWMTTGPMMLTSWWRTRRDHNLTILPSHFFLPIHHTGVMYDGGGPVIAENKWLTTIR